MSASTGTSASEYGDRFAGEPPPSPKAGLVEVEVDGEIVVYDPQTDLLHHLDRTASVVWSLLDGKLTLSALAELLAAGDPAAETTLRRDVFDLAGVLWDSRLLRGSVANVTPTKRRPVGRCFVSGPLSVPLSELGLSRRPLPAASHRTRRHRALEHEFEVATNDAAVRDYLDDILIDLDPSVDGEPDRYELLCLPAGADGQRYLVQHNREPITATDWLDRALAVLLWCINAEVIRRTTPRYALLHAAAAVLRGAAVLLPGPPESGKTTTVAGLVRAGFGYLTDEAVAIDADTILAQPYPKPLSVDRGSWDVLADLRPSHHGRVSGQWHLPARLIRPEAVAGPAPVRFVVVPVFKTSTATRLEPMSRGEALMILADSTFQFRDDARRNLAVLARVVVGADCYRLLIDDLDSAVTLIGELVGSEQLDVTERKPPVTQRRH